MSKGKGRQWDGKSRVSNDTYRKRWNEIFKKKDPDEPDPNWIEGYNKWKKQGIIDDKIKLKDLKKINLNEKYNAEKDVKKIIKNAN